MEIDEARWDAAAARHDHAAALLAAGDIAGAEAEARAALAALEDVLGPDHPDVANALDTWAAALDPLGRLDESLALRRRAGAILGTWTHEPAADPVAASVLRSLAYALVQAGAYSEADTALASAAAAARRAFGARSLDGAACIELAGVLARMQGRHEEAAQRYHTAKRLYSRLLGRVPPTLLHNLAGLACARGELTEAERFARAAITARRAEDPVSALGLGGDLAGLGDALAGLGRLDEAVAAYQEALVCLERAGLEAHPEAAYALHNLADALADRGDHRDAERAYRAALARKEALFGRRHHEVAGTLNNLAALLAGTGRGAAAQALAAEAVAIVEAILAPDHPVRAHCVALAASLTRPDGAAARQA
jgi:tetratricopeptide (TPR) repeat protein